MDRDRFLSLRFRPFMELEFINERMKDGSFTFIPVMLLAVDWDNDTFKVIPIPRGNFEEIEFWTSRDHIELPKKKMKLV